MENVLPESYCDRSLKWLRYYLEHDAGLFNCVIVRTGESLCFHPTRLIRSDVVVLRYSLTEPEMRGRNELILTPNELRDLSNALIQSPRKHRIAYYENQDLKGRILSRKCSAILTNSSVIKLLHLAIWFISES